MSQPATISPAITNTGASVVTGDIGISPGTAITGFPPGTLSGGTTHNNDATASTAEANALTALQDGQGRTVGNGTVSGGVYTPSTVPGADLTAQDLGGMTLPGGVYGFGTTAGLTGTLTLDWNNNAASVWIFKIGSTLTTTSSSIVNMINVPTGDNLIPVFWIVGSSATLGTTSTIIGTILTGVSITATTSANTGPLLATAGEVTMDTNSVESYNNATISGGDPHIVTLDGSRLDVYEPGFYRMFDSNDKMIINTEIIRINDTDMYDKFLITYPDGKQTRIEFKEDYIEVDGVKSETGKWSNTYVEPNNKYYIIEVESEFRSFYMRTNNGNTPMNYHGLLTGEILLIESLYDNTKFNHDHYITLNYYKYNSLLCGQHAPHIVKFNKDMLFIYKGNKLRLFQDDCITVNAVFNENKLLKELMVIKDFKFDHYIWTGNDILNLTLTCNGIESPKLNEYKTDNLILRIQDNAAVSIGLRTLNNISGLLCGDIIEIDSLNDIHQNNINEYRHIITKSENNSNYARFVEFV